jgi:predicted MFS family arabinose efflux permease
LVDMDTSAQRYSFRYRWIVLTVTLLAFVAYAFSFQIVPPLIPSILSEFGVSNAEAGLLMSIVLLPGLVLSIFVSLAISKFGAKKVIILSLILVLTGTLISSSANSYIVLLLGRLFLGIGGAVLLPAAPTIISLWFEKRELGKAMGIFSINMPLATVFALPVGGALASVGWRYAFYLSSALAIIATLAFIILFKDRPIEQGDSCGMRKALGSLELWKLAILWLLFQATMLSFLTWAPSLLERFSGMTQIEAGFFTSILSWISLIFVPIYGSLSDRYGKRRMFIISGFALMSLIFALISLDSSFGLLFSFVALGASSAMVPSIVQTLPAEVLGPGMASVGFGIMTILGNVGPILAPPLIGYALDSTGSFFICVTILALISAVGTLLAFSLKTK